MYMEILEQEVEALNAEVSRLRLMVHRVTQAMDSHGPPHPHGHTDPEQLAHNHALSRSDPRNPTNVQVTMDSYKELLPVIQLLLAQQQQHVEKKQKSKRHGRRSGKSSTSSASCTSPVTSAASTASTSSSPSASQEIPQKPLILLKKSSDDVIAPQLSTSPGQIKQRERVLEAFQAATQQSSPAGDKQQVFSAPSNATTAVAATALPQQAATATAPAALSVLDRLRAQREEAHKDKSISSASSNWMPMRQPQSRPAAVAPAQRQVPPVQHVHDEETTESESQSQVLPTNTMQRASPNASAELAGATTLPAAPSLSKETRQRQPAHPGELTYHNYTPFLGTSSTPQRLPRSSGSTFSNSDVAEAENAAGEPQDQMQVSSAQVGRSDVGSLEFSEQGVYNYSALASMANSPFASRVLEASRKPRSTTSVVTPVRTEEEERKAMLSLNTTIQKQLPGQASVLSRAPALSSATSSSSSSSNGEHFPHAPVKLAPSSNAGVPPTAVSPFGSGVVLGARQPIGVRNAAAAAGNTHVSGPSKTAVLHPQVFDAHATFLAKRRPAPASRNSSDSSSSSSAEDLAAVGFVPPQRPLRQPIVDDHRESSFHHLSDAASSTNPTASLHTRTSGSQPSFPPRAQPSKASPPQPIRSPSMSQDAYSFAAYSLQYSAQGTPPQHELDVEQSRQLGSRVLSPPASRPQTAHGASPAASLRNLRGSIASGGYYYGYEPGLGSVSQPSMLSNGRMEGSAPGSSSASDY